MRQHGDIAWIERRRALGVGAEGGDAAGDPAHRPDQQKQHRQIDQPAGHPGDHQRQNGKIAGELLQRAAEAAFPQPDLDLGMRTERAGVQHPDPCGSPAAGWRGARGGRGRTGSPAAGRSWHRSALRRCRSRRLHRHGRSAGSLPPRTDAATRPAAPGPSVHPLEASTAIEASSTRPYIQLDRSCAMYGRNTTISLSSTASVATSQRRPDRLWRGLTRGGPAFGSLMATRWVERRLTATMRGGEPTPCFAARTAAARSSCRPRACLPRLRVG